MGRTQMTDKEIIANKLMELDEYRTLGTVDEFRKIKSDYYDAIFDLRQYEKDKKKIFEQLDKLYWRYYDMYGELENNPSLQALKTAMDIVKWRLKENDN